MMKGNQSHSFPYQYLPVIFKLGKYGKGREWLAFLDMCSKPVGKCCPCAEVPNHFRFKGSSIESSTAQTWEVTWQITFTWEVHQFCNWTYTMVTPRPSNYVEKKVVVAIFIMKLIYKQTFGIQNFYHFFHNWTKNSQCNPTVCITLESFKDFLNKMPVKGQQSTKPSWRWMVSRGVVTPRISSYYASKLI